MKKNERTLTKLAHATKGATSLALLTLALGNNVQAGDLYWDGTATSWNTATGWSTSASSTTPDPASAPGSADVALFNIDSVSGTQSLSLDANQTASKLKVLGSATGGATLLGGGTDWTLSLGTGGIDILGGAGPVVIGSKVAGQGVPVALTGAQTWTNGCSNPMTVNNAISGTSTATLTLSGAGGGFRFNGSNTFSGGITLKAGTVLEIGHDNSLGFGTFVSDNGNLLAEDFPRSVSTMFLELNDLPSTWVGDGAMTLTGDGINSAVSIGQWKNKPFYVNRTAPVVISGIWSLCNSTVPNNGGVGPTLSSGANVALVGEIRDFNAGNSTGPATVGMGFGFTGAGANLVLWGNNLFGGKGANSASFSVNANAGYNAISVGGPGGEGAVITPLGLAALATNDGRGVFLKALETGQILTNNIAFGASVNNAGSIPIGFDGENDMTLAGKISTGVSCSIPNLATGTLTLAGEMSAGTKTLTILGSGNTVLPIGSTITGTTGGFGKTGPGTLKLAATNTLAGSTPLNGGTVVLDYATVNTNLIAQGTTASALTLGGVDLQLKGGNFAQALGIGGGTTMGAGQSRVRRTDGGSSTISLGSMTRAFGLGSAIDFESGVASTTSASVNGTLGGYATVDGTDWAIGGGTIFALTAYDSFAVPGTDKNILQTGSGTAGYVTVNTLKIVTTGADESLTITGTGSTLVLARSGLLFVGDDDYTITGNKICGATSYLGDMVVHQYGSGTLTIASGISSYALTKAGPGKLILSNPANTFSTSTFLNDGILSVSESGNLGSGGGSNGLTLNGGTLETTAGFSTSRNVVLGANGGTVQVDTGTLELSGIISSSYGILNKTGPGTLRLSGVNTYFGPTIISEGTLQLGNDRGLGCSTNSNRSLSPVYIKNGSVLDIAGRSAFIGNVTLEDGTVADSVGGGILGAYSFTVNTGTVDVALADVIVPNTANTFNSINLFKRSTGTVTLAGTNTYSGTTFVEAGTLRVTGSLASSVIVQSNGTFCGSGTIARTINVEGGTLLPGADDSGTGTLTLSRHLRLSSNGTLKAAVSGSGSGRIVLTNQLARVLLENPVLDISLLSGGAAAFASGITLIDNQGVNPIEGTFLGLPEGGSLDLGSQRVADITYLGGDGNDVALILQYRGSVILVR